MAIPLLPLNIIFLLFTQILSALPQELFIKTGRAWPKFYTYIPFIYLYIEQDDWFRRDFMKKYKIVAAIIVLVILAAVLFKCSDIDVSNPAQTGVTTGGAVDTTTIPANSEFLQDESE
jgi:hypothetical protein